MQPVEAAAGKLAHEQTLRPVWRTFRNILMVVFLIFVFAIVQVFMLRRVCNTGMRTAESLEHEGLPTLNELALLQENLAAFRLNSYECLFARDAEKAGKARALAAITARTRAELKNLQTLFPDGEGRRLASNLESAFDGLESEFAEVRSLTDSDFAAAMKKMDSDIPPRIAQVTAAAAGLKDFGYHFSGGEANATFDSFGWIKKNALVFGVANILVAFGAVIFVLLAARRSRAQLSDTLARLDERTAELASSLSLVTATLESTTDGILVTDAQGTVRDFNAQFAQLLQVPKEAVASMDGQAMLVSALVQLKDPEAFLGKVKELEHAPDADSFDVLEFKDGRTFERYSKPQRVGARTVGRVWSFRDITQRRKSGADLEAMHSKLLTTSRRAGMAEVATGVLHNVGNVLNSVNVSCELVCRNLAKSKAAKLSKVAALLTEHEKDLGAFLTSDPRGRHVPGYLAQLAGILAAEQTDALRELATLQKNVGHIKDIVAMQQNYARVSGVTEVIKVCDLIEDAVGMESDSLARHDVKLSHEYPPDLPSITADKHKVLQILLNLITNAKHACAESERNDKRLILRAVNGGDRVRISVCDNGVGIPAENLLRVFNHGFTTKPDGHGFGLHSGALAAKELGGALTVHSDGPGMGATFTLELPVQGKSYQTDFTHRPPGQLPAELATAAQPCA